MLLTKNRMVKPKQEPAQKNTAMGIKKASDSPEILEKIQKKAYELYEKRGCVDGYDLEDWIEAERLVMAEMYAIN